MEGEMTFWEHLDVLRSSIIRMLLAAVVMAIAAFCLKDWLFDFVLAPSQADFFVYRWLNIDSQTLRLVNTELTEQFLRLSPALHDPFHRPDAPLERAAEAVRTDEGDVISGFRHQILFHADLRSDETDLSVRIPPSDFVGDGHGRVNMAAGPAAGHDHFHSVSPSGSGFCLEIFIRTPAANRNMRIPLPP